MKEILKMASSEIPSRPPGKLYTEFQLEFWETQLEEMQKEQDQKNEMMDAAVKDDAALIYTESIEIFFCYAIYLLYNFYFNLLNSINAI